MCTHGDVLAPTELIRSITLHIQTRSLREYKSCAHDPQNQPSIWPTIPSSRERQSKLRLCDKRIWIIYCNSKIYFLHFSNNKLPFGFLKCCFNIRTILNEFILQLLHLSLLIINTYKLNNHLFPCLDCARRILKTVKRVSVCKFIYV